MDKWALLPLRNYTNAVTLAAGIQAALNNATTLISGVLNDGNNTPDPPFTVTFDADVGQLKVNHKIVYDNTANPTVQKHWVHVQNVEQG